MTRWTKLSLAAMALLATACGRTGGSPGSEAITVLAAASLTESFTELGRQFEAAHPSVDVTFSFDASLTLARQVTAGAPADVLATADEATIQPLAASGAVGPPAVFAHNRLAILVARGNPMAVRSLADLARPDVVVVLCSPEVPCGRFGSQALDRAGVVVRPRSLEPNVKGVVSKVTLGEADAGIVYVTDVRAASGRGSSVDIPDAHNVAAAYAVAVVRAAPHPAQAEAFVAFVRSNEGQAVLAAAGFGP